MIVETLKKLFSVKEVPSKIVDLRPDQALAEEIDCCPICKSADIKKTVWKLPGFKPRSTMRVATERYGLGIDIEWNCPCGFHHKGQLFK